MLLEVAPTSVSYFMYWVLPKPDLIILRKMVLEFNASPGMTELRQKADGWKLWKDSGQQVDFLLGMKFMMDRRDEHFHVVCTNFTGFVNQKFSPDPTWKSGCMRTGFYGMESRALCELVSLMIPEEGTLEEEKNWTVCKTVFCSLAPHIEEKVRNKGIAK